MKILHICRQYFPSVGGVEHFVADLAERLVKDGNSVEVATLNRLWRSNKPLMPFEIVAGIPVHRLPFVGGALFFFAPTILARVSQFDVLHVHNTDFFLDYLVATEWFHHKPIVVSTHGGFFHTPAQSTIKTLYFKWLTQRSMRSAAVVIPNSVSDARRFGPYAKRAVRIDNAIDYPRYATIQRQPIPGRCLTIGRLAPNKNLAGLLTVFAEAYTQDPTLSLTVIGDGEERPILESLAITLGISRAVNWLGFVEMATLLAELGKAEIFLSAAQYEGFGLSVLEAMAAGVIPLVNRIEAFEALITDGQNGFLIDYDQAPLAGQQILKIVRLADLEKKQLGQNAQAQAADYSWDVTVPKFEKVYRQVSNQN